MLHKVAPVATLGWDITGEVSCFAYSAALKSVVFVFLVEKSPKFLSLRFRDFSSTQKASSLIFSKKGVYKHLI